MRFRLFIAALLLALPSWGAFPTVSFRTNSTNVTGTTSHTVNFGTTVSSGQLLVAMFVFKGNGSNGGCGPGGPPCFTWPTGWTSISSNNQAANVRLEIRYKAADGTEGSSMSITSTVSGSSVARVWVIASGTYTGNPAAGTAAGGTSTSPDPPTLSPSWGSDDNLWIVVNGVSTARSTSGFDANLTQTGTQTIGNTTTGSGEGYGERQFASATYDPTAFTISASTDWLAQTIAVRGVASSTSLKDPIMRGVIPVAR
jgi:hypothetical protein